MAHSGAHEPEITDDSASGEIAKTNPLAHSGARELETTTAEGAPDELAKTNPLAHSGARRLHELSTRQLAAVRLLARGHGTMRAAQRLGVNRHTIARWKRDPLFAAEVQRIVASLRESALRLREGSRMHGYFDDSIYAARRTG